MIFSNRSSGNYIIGTDNVLEEAILHNVERVVCLSTDKSAYPINAMGISKAMMEKTFVAKARPSSNTVIWVPSIEM